MLEPEMSALVLYITGSIAILLLLCMIVSYIIKLSYEFVTGIHIVDPLVRLLVRLRSFYWSPGPIRPDTSWLYDTSKDPLPISDFYTGSITWIMGRVLLAAFITLFIGYLWPILTYILILCIVRYYYRYRQNLKTNKGK